MQYTSAFICLCFVAIVSAEFGQYIPKAFYTIDANGHQSALSLISPNSQQKILHRLRRAAQFSSSSSSSSSTSTNGGPVFFQQTSSNQVNPGYPGFTANGVHPNLVGSLGNTLDSRFSDDSIGNSAAPVGGSGVYTQTSGIIYPDGQIHYTSNTGRVRK